MVLYEISKKVTYLPVYYVLLFHVTNTEVLNFQQQCFARFYFGLAHVCLYYSILTYISLACSTDLYTYEYIPYVCANSKSPKTNVYANYVPKARLLLTIYFIPITPHLTTNNLLRISLFRFLYATVLISIGHNGFHHTPFT